ncbi:ankyrin repeat-containing domain protein, partial [Baffinella frigidus]
MPRRASSKGRSSSVAPVEEVTPPAKATPAKPKGTAGKRPRASEDARASSKGRSSSVAPVEEATPPAKATPAKPKGSTGKRPRASEDGAPGSAKAGRKSDMDAAMVERIVRSLNNSTGKICWATGEGIKEPINDMGETFLHWAAFNGDSDAVRWLVDSGADCSAKDKLGKTPLCRCANGDSDCVKLLLQSNTDVNHQDADGVTALHRAALAQCVTNLQLLLRAGALPNACSDATGHSPLHDACFGGDLKCAQALVTHGAQVDMHVKAGKVDMHVKAGKILAVTKGEVVTHGAPVDMDAKGGVCISLLLWLVLEVTHGAGNTAGAQALHFAAVERGGGGRDTEWAQALLLCALALGRNNAGAQALHFAAQQ